MTTTTIGSSTPLEASLGSYTEVTAATAETAAKTSSQENGDQAGKLSHANATSKNIFFSFPIFIF
jgi:hypothetical protein